MTSRVDDREDPAEGDAKALGPSDLGLVFFSMGELADENEEPWDFAGSVAEESLEDDAAAETA